MSELDARDEALARLAREAHNPPPPTPREEMWAALQARIRAEAEGDGPARDGIRSLQEARRRRGWSSMRWAGLAVAASATLLLGVGIGRMTAPTPAGDDVPVLASTSESERGVPSAAARTVAAQHLAATETLLSFVQADASAGRFDEQVGSWGRGLLVETRLLLDSEVGRDPALRELLEDMEVILAQVAILADTKAPARGREELKLIARGVQEQQMMTRIQTALPAMDAGLSGT
jgi:hypothetical protein